MEADTFNMTDNDLKIINNSITRLLARREHSRHELLNKLLARGMDAKLCLEQLDKFTEKDIQSDIRFTESLFRARTQKGYGENRIKGELREHNIDGDIAQQVMAELEIDWFELAASVARQKFGESKAADWQEQQKRNRFLQYRGFTLEQIKYANSTSF